MTVSAAIITAIIITRLEGVPEPMNMGIGPMKMISPPATELVLVGCWAGAS